MRRLRRPPARRHRRISFEIFEPRLPLAGLPDINHDGTLAPQDALLVTNYVLYMSGPQCPPDGCVTYPFFPPGLGFSDYDNSPNPFPDGFISPQDILRVINFLNVQPVTQDNVAGGGINSGTALMRVTLTTTNTAGNPITSVPVGTGFLLNAFVQDLRPASALDSRGVFASYVDVNYDEDKLSVAGAVSHGSSFPHARAGSLSPTPGLLDDVGGMGNPGFPLGSGLGSILLFSVPLVADVAGSVIFTGLAPALKPLHSSLVFGVNDPVPIEFVNATLTVAAGPSNLQLAYGGAGTPLSVTEVNPGNDTVAVSETAPGSLRIAARLKNRPSSSRGNSSTSILPATTATTSFWSSPRNPTRGSTTKFPAMSTATDTSLPKTCSTLSTLSTRKVPVQFRMTP